MCNQCTTYNKAIQVNRSIDPTRTTAIRKRFANETKRIIRDLNRSIYTSIVTNDCFGLLPMQVNASEPTRVRQFAFNTNEEKITEFLKWIDEQNQTGLLRTETVIQNGQPINAAWSNQYVTESYERGYLRANGEMQKAGYTLPTSITEASVIYNTPTHLDRLGVLYTRTFNELKGITTSMDTAISRILAQGLADGDSPLVLAQSLKKALTGVGNLDLTDTLGRFIPAERRAEIMARTEVIRAHHQATIQQYKNWGVQGVEVQAEFRTAGDNRVCQECSGLEGTVYELDAAMNIIPVHPQCRCMMLPIRIK